MEGVGRLGRSSTRYGGPATVFTGRVRRWRKKWVHISNPNNNNANCGNGSGNVTTSHLLLYKWTPTSDNGNGGSDGGTGPSTPAIAAVVSEDAVAASMEEPPGKKFRYVPVAVIDEQKGEASSQVDDEPQNVYDNVSGKGKSETNDVVVDASEIDKKAEENDQPAPLDEDPTLDLNLILKAHEYEGDSNTTDQVECGDLSEGVSGSDIKERPAAGSEGKNKPKSKKSDL